MLSKKKQAFKKDRVSNGNRISKRLTPGEFESQLDNAIKEGTEKFNKGRGKLNERKRKR